MLHTKEDSSHPQFSAGFLALIQAELIRTRNSALQWFPLVGLLIGVISSTFSFWSSGADDASGVLSWQAMFVTGMAAPLLALLGGLSEDRERSARNGGVDLRFVSMQGTRAARLIVLILISALLHCLNFGTAWMLSVLAGRDGAGLLLEAGLLSFIANISTVAIFALIARFIPLIAVLLLAMIYQLIGTLTAENTLWMFIPPSWSVRVMLPVLGIHANAVPIEPGNTLLEESLVLALVLCTIFGAIACYLVIIVSPRRPKAIKNRRSDNNSNSDGDTELEQLGKTLTDSTLDAETNLRTEASAWQSLLAVNVALLKSSATYLSVFAVILLLVVGYVYDSDYVTGLYTYFLLPVGAGFLPVLTWRAVSTAWALSVTENAKLRTAFLAWHFLLILIISVAAVGACIFTTSLTGDVLRMLLLWGTTGTILTFLSAIICIRFGSGAAIAWTIFVTVLAATLGGDVLAETALWIVALPAWPVIANTQIRFWIAIAMQIPLFAIAIPIVYKTMRSHERAS